MPPPPASLLLLPHRRRPPAPMRPAFLLPCSAASPLLTAARRTAAAAAAALAVCLSPASLPAHFHAFAPPPVAAAALPQLDPSARKHPSNPPAASPTPVVVFDKDYAPHPPLWHFDLSEPSSSYPRPSPSPPPPPPPRPTLPPGPSASSELRILTRLLVALVVGGFIGMERRAANSLAGVRTFSLVSLGAAIFMTTTLVAFPNADPTRVAAAISSSVGFLGAGAMQKNAKHHRGLTTASSVWLAAALGIAAASGMFLLSFAGAVSTVLIARYARFDSSLHLIRGNPLIGEGEEERAKRLKKRKEFGRRRTGFEYAGTNGVHGVYADRTQAGYRYESGNGRAPTDTVQLQALVDFDPSSQGAREGDEEGGEMDKGKTGKDNGSGQ